MIRISPDLWESKYTGEFEANNVARENKKVTVDETIENKTGRMEPVTFAIEGYQALNKIAFIDGVQRLDMHATIEDNGFPFQGIFSSNAAGYLMVNPNGVNSLSECFPE